MAPSSGARAAYAEDDEVIILTESEVALLPRRHRGSGTVSAKLPEARKGQSVGPASHASQGDQDLDTSLAQRVAALRLSSSKPSEAPAPACTKKKAASPATLESFWRKGGKLPDAQPLSGSKTAASVPIKQEDSGAPAEPPTIPKSSKGVAKPQPDCKPEAAPAKNASKKDAGTKPSSKTKAAQQPGGKKPAPAPPPATATAKPDAVKVTEGQLEAASKLKLFSFDIETTGFLTTSARILEIAVVELVPSASTSRSGTSAGCGADSGGDPAGTGGSSSSGSGTNAFQPGRSYSTLINPDMKFRKGVSGISMGNVKAAGIPRTFTALHGAIKFVEHVTREQGPDCVPLLISHNGAAFDFPFLMFEAQRVGLQVPPSWAYLDTLLLARRLELPLKSLKQDALREHYSIPAPTALHRALDDALVLAQLAPAMLLDFAHTFGLDGPACTLGTGPPAGADAGAGAAGGGIEGADSHSGTDKAIAALAALMDPGSTVKAAGGFFGSLQLPEKLQAGEGSEEEDKEGDAEDEADEGEEASDTAPAADVSSKTGRGAAAKPGTAGDKVVGTDKALSWPESAVASQPGLKLLTPAQFLAAAQQGRLQVVPRQAGSGAGSMQTYDVLLAAAPLGPLASLFQKQQKQQASQPAPGTGAAEGSGPQPQSQSSQSATPAPSRFAVVLQGMKVAYDMDARYAFKEGPVRGAASLGPAFEAAAAGLRPDFKMQLGGGSAKASGELEQVGAVFDSLAASLAPAPGGGAGAAAGAAAAAGTAPAAGQAGCTAAAGSQPALPLFTSLKHTAGKAVLKASLPGEVAADYTSPDAPGSTADAGSTSFPMPMVSWSLSTPLHSKATGKPVALRLHPAVWPSKGAQAAGQGGGAGAAQGLTWQQTLEAAKEANVGALNRVLGKGKACDVVLAPDIVWCSRSGKVRGAGAKLSVLAVRLQQ